MKNIFPGFYGPTEAESEKLWAEALFVLDSSVLLRLYEVPERTRQETFAAFEKLGDRLWVPHQAALEYHRNRERTIGIAKGRVEEALKPMQDALEAFMTSANSVKLAERGYQTASDRLTDLKAAADEVMQAAQAAIASHVAINGNDPVRDELGRLLDGKVGAAPTEEELAQWTKDAAQRFTHRMGPGHLDETKMKNPTYMMDGLIFDKRYADVYVWKETIARASDANVTSVVMITNDSKPDWWKKTDYGVVGPLPEICAEIRKEAALENYWMYDLNGFMSEAETRLQVSVSATTLSDVAETSPFLLAEKEVRASIELWNTLTDEDRGRVRNGALHKMMVKYGQDALEKALLSRGFAVLKSDGDVAVGFQTSGEYRVGVAIHGFDAASRGARRMVCREIAQILPVTPLSRIEILLVGGVEISPNDINEVFSEFERDIRRLNVKDVVLSMNHIVSESTVHAIDAKL
ncbi:TPA: PIN-like domain-containing protein [Stenotrophomonas maltophilia]